MKKRRKTKRSKQNGTIKPSAEDFELVEREYPTETPAEKYRLAQASALLRWFESMNKE